MSKVEFGALFLEPLRNGVTKPKRVRGSGYKMVNMGEIFSLSFIQNQTMDRVPLTDKEKAATLLQNNDLLFARQSLVRDGAGKCSIFLNDNEPVCFESHIIRVRLNQELCYPMFYYYFFSSRLGKNTMDKIIEQGAGAAGIRGSDLAKLEVPYIEYSKQKEIADSLYSFDQKIQLNTQINQTLEQIAQALLKSWFVDFDPVRAKVQALSDGLSLEQAELAAMQAISGKTAEELTALSQTQPERYAELVETAKAFPCEMVEVDGVEIPKGWEIKALPEIIDFLEGPGIRNWQYTDEEDGIKFINIRCIQNGDLTLTTANKITKEEAFGKYKHFQLEEDDIVVSTSGTLGRFAFVRKEHLPLSLNTSVIRFRPIKNKSTLGFIAGFVENQLQHELEIRASGSAQRNFGPTHLKQISLLVPDFKLLELHQKYVSSLFEKRKQLLSEIDLLKDTRDLLLPKLLNGEI
ncbi:restriction endonuclease subunit S [Haemophilus seminalis]|uniref:restriction endonuclease subunit S n=1 Tax=Haemophilus TaxID=724 RepID=UPI001C058AE8|nr:MULTISPECIES: restriction endonuclease subunit S [Haemophilus]MBS5999584.1 restriction endonuclease subunit S [Haemophilus haemolyticus]UJZ89535.1 restriction endonuclease subunit S [Haemophilus seminalis]